MSHIVEIKTQVRDPSAVAATCRRLSLPEPRHDCFQVFNARATGLGVQLPDWSYPVVFDTANGTVQFDNFNGVWGKQAELDRFLQIYAVEKASMEARKRGHSVCEQTLEDGSIKLTIQVGGHS